MTREPSTAVADGRVSLGERVDRYAIPALSVLGIVIAGYLTYIRVAGGEALCVGVGGCDVVQNSAYAQIMGVPVALLGLVGNLMLLALSLWRLRVGVDEPNVALAIFGLALFSVLFAAYLFYVELFVLEAI